MSQVKKKVGLKLSEVQYLSRKSREAEEAFYVTNLVSLKMGELTSLLEEVNSKEKS